jgi:hypothetical protein
MLTSEDHALLVDVQDRLIDLFVQQDEARRAEDWPRVRVLREEIADTRFHQNNARRSIPRRMENGGKR